MNATDGTDARTAEESDRLFDTPSFIINIKLVGVPFFKYSVNCDLFLFINSFVACLLRELRWVETPLNGRWTPSSVAVNH